MRAKVSTRVLVVVGVAVALLMAGVVSRFASSHPDGLTKVSEDHGFAGAGTTHDGLLAYGGVSGVIGVLVVLAVVGVTVYLLRRRRTSD
ncbi:MAG: PDGLE domain-containing protein [Nocardioides sp.]